MNPDASQMTALTAKQAQAPAAMRVAGLRGWKRILDVVGVVASLPVTLPLMVLIALWIKWISPGPVMVRQKRVGRFGTSFVLYKFRSMMRDASSEEQAAYMRHLVAFDRQLIKMDLVCDARLLPGGCLMRALGLDELPQLWNILKGEMSLVGPRPCLPSEHVFFSPRQRERFTALPGLTGLWQVTGKNHCTFREMNDMDLYYVRHCSLELDLRIICRTPGALAGQMRLAIRQKRSIYSNLALQDPATKIGSNLEASHEL